MCGSLAWGTYIVSVVISISVYALVIPFYIVGNKDDKLIKRNRFVNIGFILLKPEINHPVFRRHTGNRDMRLRRV